MKFILSFLLVVASCSFKKSQLENQTLKGHSELYSEPETPKLQDLSEDERRIVIASTNDIHGNLEGEPLRFTDDHSKGLQTIQVGGKDTASAYFKILRDTYKNVALVDSGDILGSTSGLKAIQAFYENERYDAVTVGLGDFNLKVPTDVGSNTQLFKKFAEHSKTPLLFSNLYDLKTARLVEWKGAESHVIKDHGGVRVGIIGLIPDDIVAQTPVNNRVGLFIENMLQSTLRQARLLRSLGADVVVVLTHQGLDCGNALAEDQKLPLMKVNFEPRRESVCDLKSPLGVYLERLPHDLVDVVIGGRNHQKMANFVNGILVMGGYADGKSFSYSELVVNTKTKRVVKDKIQVHQPVMFCQEFFKETRDCYSEDTSVNHQVRIPATFLGKSITKDLAKTLRDAPKKTELKRDSSKALISFQSDLTYVPPGGGKTQLYVLSLSGRDLLKFLEEDYNRGRKADWQPSPYLLRGEDLSVSIAGVEIDLTKSYRILTDLESIQKNRRMVNLISKNEGEALMTESWSSLHEDSVSVTLAGQKR